MLTIMYDMDGVVANLHKAWLEAYNVEFNDNVQPSDILSWDIKDYIKSEAKTTIMKYINQEGFYSNVEPNMDFIDEAREFIYLGHNIGICTSCNNNPVMISEKVKWLKKNMPFLNRNNITFMNNKGLVRADILVDDRVKNIVDFLTSNPNARATIVRCPHNREEIKRLNGRILSRITFTDKEY
ncbi:MAG: hypothetical protein PF569_06410 [Candidatus Woesearchaeota archaeon]|jgi:5'-nucleotidase|nr:hypothetical protein [Candidatus Woesearchaeota archaeon]